MHGAWRMSDGDHAFIMEETRNRELFNEYDEELALQVREEKEKPQAWQEATTSLNNESDGEDGEEGCV